MRWISLLLLGACLLATGCGREEKVAEQLFDKGKRYEKARQYPAALEVYRHIQKNYPETRAARMVDESVDFKFIEEAMAIDRRKNVSEVKEHLKQIAKAVESYYFKQEFYPMRLDVLVPAYLQALPRDPWGARYQYGPIRDDEIFDPGEPTGGEEATEEGEAAADGYMVAWFGRDRLPGGDGDDADIFVRNGQLIGF